MHRGLTSCRQRGRGTFPSWSLHLLRCPECSTIGPSRSRYTSWLHNSPADNVLSSLMPHWNLLCLFSTEGKMSWFFMYFFKYIINFPCVCAVFCLYVCLCTRSTPCAWGGQTMVLDPLGLELKEIVSHAGAGKTAQVLWRCQCP